jgi:hypothetical protein
VPAKDATGPGTVGQTDVYKSKYEGKGQTKYQATYGKGDPKDEDTNGFQKPDVRVNLGETSGETKSASAEGRRSVTGEYGTASGSAEYTVGAGADGKVNASVGSDGLMVGAEGAPSPAPKRRSTARSRVDTSRHREASVLVARGQGRRRRDHRADGVKAEAGAALRGGKAEASGTSTSAA